MIDQCYLVTVKELRDYLKGLCDFDRHVKYRMLEVTDSAVTIFFNEDTAKDPMNLNATIFRFPIIEYVTTLAMATRHSEGGQLVCISVYTKKQLQRSLYFEGEDVKPDEIEDWLRFWAPLQAKLQYEVEQLLQLGNDQKL